MNLIGCVAAFVAMVLAYLASPNQRLLARPLRPSVRLVAWVFAVIAVVAWIVGEGSLPGIFSALTAAMLAAVALPYLVWLVRPAVARRPR